MPQGSTFNCDIGFTPIFTKPCTIAEDVCAVLDELALVGERVELAVRLRPILSDPDDEMVLETAINGRADAIVTLNEQDFRRVAGRFRCSVLRPVEAVRQLTRAND